MNIEKWLDSVLEKKLPEKTNAIVFNLYEDEANKWSVEMVGTGSFDMQDPDWACDELFDTRDNFLTWSQEANWKTILQETADEIRNYTETGKYAEKLKSYKGIGVGFVDGDIEIVYQK